MPLYLVERDLPSATLASLNAVRQAAVRACHALAAEGRPVRYLRSTFTPGIHAVGACSRRRTPTWCSRSTTPRSSPMA